MRPDYQDIIDRAGQPRWYDEHGVPRYSDLHPNRLGVYDDEAVFYVIVCQACTVTFTVGEGHSFMSGMRVSSHVERGAHLPFYGDPPQHTNPQGQRCAGDTMTSDTIHVISYWSRKIGDTWARYEWDDIRDRTLELERAQEDPDD